MFNAQMSIILASASPRRQAFLSEIGLAFSLAPPSGAEPLPHAGEQPQTFAMRAAAFKAHAACAKQPEIAGRQRVIIGADTIVAASGEILGKPSDAEDALAMLKLLSGRRHCVYTGCCCLFPDSAPRREELFFEESQVWMRHFPPEVLAAYVRSGEPMDKAGAYAVQGKGAFLVEKIEGSWTNIVGLPLTGLLEALLRNKAICPAKAGQGGLAS